MTDVMSVHTIATSADRIVQVASTAQEDGELRFELLANFLRPRFGDVYDYDPEIDLARWPADLKQAVRHFLLTSLSSEELATLLHALADDADQEDAARRGDVDVLLDGLEPWQVALEVRKAAVIAVPTLHQLLDELHVSNLNDWPSNDDRWDVAVWIEAHSTPSERRKAMSYHWLLDGSAPEPDDVVDRLSPAELGAAWKKVIGPAPSDLTDIEWDLLWPLLRTAHAQGNYHECRAHQAVNGMLYRFENQVAWPDIPVRYGKYPTPYMRHARYRHDGTYLRISESLETMSEAARLVTWARAAAS